jgi:hypothetical protein
MDNDTDILCEAVRDSYADGILANLYGIKCIFSIIAIPPALVMCIAIIRASALHRNIRLLFVNFFIATVIANAGIILVSGYHVLALMTSNTNEELCAKVAMTGQECIFLQGLCQLGGFTVSTSLSLVDLLSYIDLAGYTPATPTPLSGPDPGQRYTRAEGWGGG